MGLTQLGNQYWIRNQLEAPFTPEEVFNILCSLQIHKPWMEKGSFCVVLETLKEKPLLQLIKTVMHRWMPFVGVECCDMLYGDKETNGDYFVVKSKVEPDMPEWGDTNSLGVRVRHANFEMHAFLIRPGPGGGTTITRLSKVASKVVFLSPLCTSAQLHIVHELLMTLDKRMCYCMWNMTLAEIMSDTAMPKCPTEELVRRTEMLLLEVTLSKASDKVTGTEGDQNKDHGSLSLDLDELLSLPNDQTGVTTPEMFPLCLHSITPTLILHSHHEESAPTSDTLPQAEYSPLSMILPPMAKFRSSHGLGHALLRKTSDASKRLTQKGGAKRKNSKKPEPLPCLLSPAVHRTITSLQSQKSRTGLPPVPIFSSSSTAFQPLSAHGQHSPDPPLGHPHATPTNKISSSNPSPTSESSPSSSSASSSSTLSWHSRLHHVRDRADVPQATLQSPWSGSGLDDHGQTFA